MSDNRKIFFCDNNEYAINESNTIPIFVGGLTWDSTSVTFDSTEETFDMT